MGEYIKKDVLYQKIAHLEELARNRYLDTPSDSPVKDRYLTQLHERTSFKHMIADECAENVAPVIHSSWELAAHFNRDHGTTDIRCPACGTTKTVKGCYESVEGDCLYNEENFCPDCGAAMTPEARKMLEMRLRGEPQ